MNFIELFIISTIFFLIFFLIMWKLFDKGCDDLKKEFYTARNNDTIEILNELKTRIMDKSDALKDKKIEVAVENTFLKTNTGVRVGLMMGVDIIDEMIEILKNPKNKPNVNKTISARETIDISKINKNKRCYTFDAVAKSMFGNDVFEEENKNENV